MKSTVIAAPATSGFTAAFLLSLRKVFRISGPEARFSDAPDPALQRLAETAPHLLEDIGYSLETEDRATGTRLWRHTRTGEELVTNDAPATRLALRGEL